MKIIIHNIFSKTLAALQAKSIVVMLRSSVKGSLNNLVLDTIMKGQLLRCWNLRMFQLKYLRSSTETLNWAWWRCNGRLSFFFWISNYNSTTFYLTFIKRIIIWILKCDWHWHDQYLRYICIVLCKYFHIYRYMIIIISKIQLMKYKHVDSHLSIHWRHLAFNSWKILR